MLKARPVKFPAPILAALLATASHAADKPAAVQLCLQLPEGVALFASEPRPFMQPIARDTWVLDFELTLNGRAPERITKSGPDCLRAWLPATKLKTATFDFTRLPLNLATQELALDLQLKADLWSDGGRVSITQLPWASAENKTDGTLTLERNGVAVTEWKQLPRGAYTLKFTPPPEPKSACPITLQVIGIGTVRPDRNATLYREMVEFYRAELMPSVIEKQKLLCEPAEAAQVTVKLVDGTYRNPLAPEISKVRIPDKERQFELTVDGKTTLLTEEGLPLEIEPGQQLEVSERPPLAVR